MQTSDIVPADGFRDELARIVSSVAFASARRSRQLLEYFVERHLAATTPRLKEYAIAIDVFRRDASFDPKIDSIVRTEVYRLRTKLSAYYRDEGSHNPLRIGFRRRSFELTIAYVPREYSAPTRAPRRAVADTLHRGPRPANHPIAMHADIGSNYLDSLMLLRFRYKYRPGAIVETAKLMAHFDDLVLSDPHNETARRGLLLSMVTFVSLVPSALPDLLPQLLAHGGRPDEASPSLVEARIGAGMAAMFNNEYTLAEDMLSSAVELAPDSAAAHVALGTLLLHIGRLHDALRETRAGERLDPQSASNASMVSLALFSLRRFDAARLQTQHSLSLDPQLLISRMLLADIELFTADRAVARRQMASICSFCGDHPLSLGKLAYAHGMGGDPVAARKVLDTLLSRSDQTSRAAPSIALGYLGLRDAKNALKWLRIASEQNSIVDIVPGSTPFFDPLRSDRKFQALLPQCA